MLAFAAAATGGLAASAFARGVLAAPGSAAQTPPLTADLRVFDAATPHNSFPDGCDQRLDRLYMAEDLDLSISVQFNRDLSDDERQQVQWLLANDDATWRSGDFSGQPNPALITTPLSPPADTDGDRTQATVYIQFRGTDIATPAPIRVVTNEEYDAAFASLASFTAVGGRPRSQLPLSVDLLSRFLGQDSTTTGTPSVSTAPLDICDPRLTHRAGADWGTETVTNVPLVQYAADQPASAIVAEATADALLSQNADAIRQYFVDHPQATSYAVSYASSGNLTLNRPTDALLALHGVQFDGMLSATVDAPPRAEARLTARDIQVQGTISDLYDFDLGAVGAGALPAAQAAMVEIASVKHDVGKIFLVSFTLDSVFDSLEL